MIFSNYIKKHHIERDIPVDGPSDQSLWLNHQWCTNQESQCP